ncbi:LTA synthase family protein [Pedobacter sp. JCM 36344]|uniref:LTA synthase family protein n=1 Tax=Pedobacter sp. JCM 36344 TaxID=3374280 RepID=UPI00397CDE60
MISSVSFTEVTSTFFHALLLDLSMVGYILVIPALSYIISMISGRKNIELKWLSGYMNLLVVLFSIISVANFNIFREWGSKINSKALEVATTTPNEALASSASSPIGLSMAVLMLLIALGFILQRTVVFGKLTFANQSIWIKLPIALVILGLNFVMIRGGISGSPINQSMAYFSKTQVLNLASVNTEWNLLSSLIASNKTKANPYIYEDAKEATDIVSGLYAVAKDSTISVLTTQRPNIVLFIMESFTADLTATLGNMQDVTPGFDTLVNKGILFSNVYSTGNRTDKGFVGTLAGFPSLAAVNIVKWPEKTEKLPSISRSLYKAGYQNSFFYGGESEFDNYKAFLLNHDVHQLTDRNNFEDGIVTSWGQFDGAVFKRQLKEMNTAQQPFFSTVLSLTNHEPFTVPGRSKFGTANNVEKFKSTAFYTDSCIISYLQLAKKQRWYKNTLFLFIADHGHIYPKNRTNVFVPERYHIPFLLYGDVIKDEYKGRVFDRVGSQSDLPATLLSQLALNTKEFRWSKNLLNPYVKSFAFFSWDDGMGFINNQQCVTFDNIGKVVLYNNKNGDEVKTATTLKLAKSYLQVVYDAFLNL